MSQELKNPYEQLRIFNVNITAEQQYEIIKQYMEEIRQMKERKIANMFFQHKFEIKEQMKKIRQWPTEIKIKILNEFIDFRKAYMKSQIELRRHNLQNQYNLQKCKEMRDKMKKQQRQFDQLPF